MPRQRSGPARKQRTKKILARAKGFRGGRRKLLRSAKEAVMRAGQYAYFSRRIKKREYRRLWIIRINAACDMRDMAYHRFINGLKKANVEINRKALSELAISEPTAFDALVETAKKALAVAS